MTDILTAKHDSNPLSYTCTCPAQTIGGQVLLFYRYFDNSPILPAEHAHRTVETRSLANFHQDLSSRLVLGGKIRVANEGFNVTIGGATPVIAEYIDMCRDHWSFAGIDLSTKEACESYFKPTAGCACVFGGKVTVKIKDEITPLAITDYSPTNWGHVVSLSPEEFHDLCHKGGAALIDVRNHYESRVGYFVTGQGDLAVRPPMRRFSQWPAYVVNHVLGNRAYNTPIATYCTGGIRCEKGARWMQETMLAKGRRSDVPVYTLRGGIVAYQAWLQHEIEAGRKNASDSFFKGKTYVFDARGSIGLKATSEKVTSCHVCGSPEDRLGTCEGSRCHLVLVLCEQCEERGGVRCCEDCRSIEIQCKVLRRHRLVCKCESDRERLLSGGKGAKLT